MAAGRLVSNYNSKVIYLNPNAQTKNPWLKIEVVVTQRFSKY